MTASGDADPHLDRQLGAGPLELRSARDQLDDRVDATTRTDPARCWT
jgi:hypothetical protein